MDILVVTNSCSQKKYDEICKKRIKPAIDPQQKFFRLMISGLAEANKGSVTALSALPVSASTIEQKTFDYEEDNSEDGVVYRYLPFKNGKITRYVSLFFSAGKYIKKWCEGKDAKNTFIIVDPLIPVIAIPVRKAAQKAGIEVCAVVTDLPTLCTNMKKRKELLIKKIFLSIYQKIADADLKSYDAYIPLTESINNAVNLKRKPYTVVEGFADSKDISVSDKHNRYLMYAGGVYEKYGLQNLVKAFMRINRKDVDLFIFGDGSYVEEIEKLHKSNSRLKYMGCLPPEKVVQYEKEALLLVNPRPTGEEFAKYSFPSKTMEYMLSGTPVVSTRLPGIPKEYFDYIYAFDADSCDSIADKLNEILELSDDELIKKGKAAHDFVQKNKNNVVMADKIIKLMSKGEQL